MKYKLLEDVAIADIAFEVYGKNYSELFQNAAEAIFELTADLKTVKPKIKKIVKLENERIDNLLYDFLSELLYLKDAEALIFCKCVVQLKEDNKKYSLNAELKGDEIAPEVHRLDNDIKAVTMHMFKVESVKGGFKATVVVDI